MTSCNSQPFVSQPVGQLLWRNSLPMVGAILALFAFDLLESSLLAFQSEHVLTAFGFTLPITAAMIALAIGLSIRSNNKVVHCNCVNKAALNQEVSNSLSKSALIVAVFSLVFYFANDALLLLTGNASLVAKAGNQHQALDQNTYMTLRYLGWVFMALIWQANAILRALGWMNMASGLMLGWALFKSLIAVVFLTPQSPLFSENLAILGVVHLIADMLFAVISLVALRSKIQLKRPSVSQFPRLKPSQSKDSVLIVVQQFITPASMAALTAIAATIDTSYVAALALLFRLEVLFLLLPMVLTTSMPAIVGANFWLGHKQRVKQIYITAFSSILLFQLFIAVTVFTQGYLLSSYICPHEAIALHLKNYLTWVPWGYGAAGIAIVYQSCLNAKNQTIQATWVGLSHRVFFVIPLTAIGAFLFNEQGFYQGLMLGHLGAIVAVIYLLKRFGLFSQDTLITPNSNNLEGMKHETKSNI